MSLCSMEKIKASFTQHRLIIFYGINRDQGMLVTDIRLSKQCLRKHSKEGALNLTLWEFKPWYKISYNQYPVDLILLMKEDILFESFFIPSGPHIPLLTSTPSGFRVATASHTFSVLIPPANNHPFLLPRWGNVNFDQLNPLPLQNVNQKWSLPYEN